MQPTNKLFQVIEENGGAAPERIDVVAYYKRDEELLTGLKAFLSEERATQVKFLAYLNEVDRRMLYASEGYPSMFAYCVNALGLSESSSLKRIQVARLVRKCPLVLNSLERCQISLTVLSRLAPFMTTDNQKEVLALGEGKPVREVERALAQRFPDYVSPKELLQRIRFLSSDRVEVTFTVSQEFVERLERAKEVMAHQCPTGRLEDIFSRGLDLLLAKNSRQNIPRGMLEGAAEPVIDGGAAIDREEVIHPPRSRHIPERVKREVWLRDSGCCTYQAKNGRVCGSRAKIEFDHIQPWALGGEHSPGNVRLLCRAHNKLAAKETFGDSFIF